MTTNSYHQNIRMSHALTMMTLLPSAAACLTCPKIRVAVSLWLQAATPSRLIVRMLKTSCCNDICCAHFYNLVWQENKELCLVIIFCHKIWPARRNFSIACLSASGSTFSLWSCFWLDGRYISNTQCLSSGTWSSTLVFKEGHPMQLTLQTLCRVVYANCSPKLNHQWWWFRPLVPTLAV